MPHHPTVVLVACYELGHQPLNLASPLAFLQRAGIAVTAVDTSVEELTDEVIDGARLVALSVPMHTALRLGTPIARRIRQRNPAAHICFYGLYATLNAKYLLQSLADSVIGGEYEQALVALAEALATTNTPEVPGVRTRQHLAGPVLTRLPLPIPSRETLPPLSRYAYLVRDEEFVPAGYVEATRGCLHTCAHCPITPVYGGRFFAVPRPVVLADIRNQVAAGARHITFGDPDFLNGPRHSLEIVRALHRDYPDVTFDATIKVEHILERREVFPELAALGCAFVVSAVESLSDLVLQRLAKGHRQHEIEAALDILDDAGIPMRPTWVAFTPWTTPDDYLAMLAFIERRNLVEAVDAVQYTIRLLVPPGSALTQTEDARQWLGPLDQEAFSHTWVHPVPAMDELHARMMPLVEQGVAARQDPYDLFAAVRQLAESCLGARTLVAVGGAGQHAAPRRSRPIPHLSEPWFC